MSYEFCVRGKLSDKGANTLDYSKNIVLELQAVISLVLLTPKKVVLISIFMKPYDFMKIEMILMAFIKINITN